MPAIHHRRDRGGRGPRASHQERQVISLEGGGVIRFRPDGSRLEVFASGTRNHLDVPMDEQDRIFVRDNTDDGDGWNTRFIYIVKDGFYGYPWAFTKHPKEVLPMIHDFGGGSPCQGWVYCDDGLPERYRGRVFHCEWGQGKIWAVKVEPDGAGFKYVDQIAFVDPSGTGVKDFRPYSIRPTADGRGFWITDWAFSGWSQKKVAGRIYKVTYVKDDVKPAPRGQEGQTMEGLVQALSHAAHGERLRIQRLIESKLTTDEDRAAFSQVGRGRVCRSGDPCDGEKALAVDRSRPTVGQTVERDPRGRGTYARRYTKARFRIRTLPCGHRPPACWASCFAKAEPRERMLMPKSPKRWSRH